jgi:hypothetical protein
MIPHSRRILAALALCSLWLRAQPSVPASAEFIAAWGLYKAVFHVPEGRISINVPNDVTAGDTILAMVYPEPSGKTPKERDRNSASLSAYALELEGARMVAGGRLRWTVPPRVPSGFSTVRLHDRKGKVLAHCDVTVSPRGADVLQPAGAASFVLPLGGTAGAPVSLWGSFPVDVVPAIRVGGFAALVIAQSPRKIVFVSPPDAVGASTLEVSFGGAAAVTGLFRVLAVQVSAGQSDLLPGQTTTMTVRVSGLSGLPSPAVLVLANQSPATVALSGGALQRIPIPSGGEGPDGAWQLTRTLTGERGGGYSIAVAVTPPPSSQIPLEQLVELSVDRWSRRSSVAVEAGARTLIASGVVAARAPLDEYFVAQLAYHADPASLLDSLLRHYCFDLRDRKLMPPGRATIGRLQPPRLPRLAQAFAPQSAVPPVSIDASDVRANPVLKYLGELLARLTPAQPVGILIVTSQPDRQQIRIGRNTGLDYYTARSFHLTAGDYTVAVAGCTESVKILPNQQSTLNCTRK